MPTSNMQLFINWTKHWRRSHSLDPRRSMYSGITADVSTVKPHRVVSACPLTIVFGPVREAGPPSLSAFM